MRIQVTTDERSLFLGCQRENVAILQREYRESGKIVSQWLRRLESFINNGLQQQRVGFAPSIVASLATVLVLSGAKVVSTRPGKVDQFGSFDPEVSSTVPVILYPVVWLHRFENGCS